MVATAAALRRFREGRLAPTLPEGFGGEVGRLMADAQRTMTKLGASLRRLERFDQPTGALNRATFAAEPGRAPVGVARLANFAHIAGSLGREAASGALRTVAARLGLQDLLAQLSRPLDAAGVRITPQVMLATAEGSEDAAAALDDAVAATEDAPVVVHSLALQARLRERFVLERSCARRSAARSSCCTSSR